MKTNSEIETILTESDRAYKEWLNEHGDSEEDLVVMLELLLDNNSADATPK